ncbi:gamma-glutamyl-gamma-aminobutyrate hydrolase family protein [Mesorhizobium sp.]|uniref:gamma-glutamyl-gamma-aminobutyrate hydrolase family protein n=1 Tax=Mesorhizobium sp. TaxID=1871066 RepID=UPI0025C4B3A1|nr:gamma-glutamyl-gamma-aminobutyrate hydrolase family protein [Mesorhizobium sp.]
MIPLIGITPDGGAPEGQPTEGEYTVRINYADAVRAAGGCPVLLPWQTENAEMLATRCDGLVITGGTPGISTKQGRTEFELALIRTALAVGRPVLGICNGMQLLGRILGASFVESISDEVTGALDHVPAPLPTNTAHPVILTPGTRLQVLAGSVDGQVNSLHRQAITGTGTFSVAALAPDGVIEAIEGPGWFIGVQWHPEYSLTALDKAIFADFVAACRGERS